MSDIILPGKTPLIVPDPSDVAHAADVDGHHLEDHASTHEAGGADPLAQYGAKIRAITDQSILATTNTEVDFGATIFDVGGVADLANNGFTVPTGAGGLWVMSATIAFEDTIGAELRFSYEVNDVFVDPRALRYLETQVSLGMKPSGPMLLNLADDDTVTVQVFVAEAGNLRGSASLSADDTWANMWRV